MDKKLYAKLSIEKENEIKEINLYKTKDKYYGIEIDTDEKGKLEVKKANNIIISEEKINNVLETIISGIENINFMEYIKEDYAEIKENIS